MKTQHLISTLSGIALAMTLVSASAENNGTWYASEDETIVLNFPGSRDKYLTSSNTAHSETPVVESDETWYVDDDDNIVLNFPGSREKYSANRMTRFAAMPKVERNDNWYVDDNDSIVLNFPGSRDRYIQM